MLCSFCKNKFSSKSSLNHHQKTAKYCIELQGGKLPTLFKCIYCSKVLSTKQNLNIHKNNCFSYNKHTYEKKWQEEKQLLINEYELRLNTTVDKLSLLQKQLTQKNEIIKDLQNKLENVALRAVSRPTTSNKTQINNYIQKMEIVTNQCLSENVDNLTIDHIKKGAEGYAEYALEYPLKNRMICSDYSRRKVKFKDKDGIVITDPEMTVLAKKFFNSIKEKNKELICQSANELKERLGDENVMDTVLKLFDYKEAVNRASDGEKTDFHHDFVRQVCSQTIKE